MLLLKLVSASPAYKANSFLYHTLFLSFTLCMWWQWWSGGSGGAVHYCSFKELCLIKFTYLHSVAFHHFMHEYVAVTVLIDQHYYILMTVCMGNYPLLFAPGLSPPHPHWDM